MSKEQLRQIRKEIYQLKEDLKGENALICYYSYRVSYLRFANIPISLAQVQLELGAAHMRAAILENKIEEKGKQLIRLVI